MTTPNNGQRSLFNHQALSSTRSHARLALERARNTFKSPANGDVKSDAGSVTVQDGKAMPSQISSGEKSGRNHPETQKPKKRFRDFSTPESEFCLQGEDRDWTVVIDACPECGWKGQHQMAVEFEKRVAPYEIYDAKYSVRCGFAETAGGRCTFQTPWFKTSADAIRHFKLTSLLSR